MSLFALNSDDGSVAWQVELLEDEDHNVGSAGVGNDGHVYVPVGDRVFALEAKSGEIVWTYKSDLNRTEALGLPNSKLVVDESGRVFIHIRDFVGLSDGAKLWERPFVPTDAGPLVGDDGTVFVAGWRQDEHKLYGLDPTSGQTQWSTPMPEPTESGRPGLRLMIENDILYYYLSRGRKVTVVDAKTGERKWTVELPFGPAWTVGTGGILYGVRLHMVAAFDPVEESTLWEFTDDVGNFRSRVAPPAVDDEHGIVYVGLYDGGLRARDAADGEELWSLELPQLFGRRPVIGPRGTVYALVRADGLYAFR